MCVCVLYAYILRALQPWVCTRPVSVADVIIGDTVIIAFTVRLCKFTSGRAVAAAAAN